MTNFKSDFLNILTDRGFVHQISDPDELDRELSSKLMSAYIGFDCTAPSLHVGNLVQIMMLHWFQQCGHRPIVLMGGGTTRVGDPSGKSESRKLLSENTIESNKSSIRRVFEQFLTFGNGKTDAIMEDNSSWLLELNYIDFLREIGRFFSINQMLQRDAIKLRLDREQHLSFLEFNYMVLQAYDFVELNRRFNVKLQMGGSDQWGNIVSGIDLGRRMQDVSLFALTTPLLTTASGSKMGKTADGAVWLDKDQLSPYEYWQFWRNTEDSDVEKFLKLFTRIPIDEVDRLAALKGVEINEAKKKLATEATALAHGINAAKKAEETARLAFEEGNLSAELPTHYIKQSDLEKGLGLLNVFVDAGLSNSNSEVRRNIKGGAIRINDLPESNEKRELNMNDLTQDGAIKISLGKKRHLLLKLDNSSINVEKK